MVIAAEIDADMDHSPVCRRAAELSTIITHDYGVSGHSFSYVEDPPRPAHCDAWKPDFDPVALKTWWDNMERIGCEHRLRTPRAKSRERSGFATLRARVLPHSA